MTIEEVLRAIESGQQITKEHTNVLISALGKSVAGKKPENSSMTAEELQSQLMAALEAVRSTPEGQAQIRAAIADKRESRFVKRYTPFFNALLAGADLVSSFEQVRASKDALRQLKRPGLPAVPGIDPALDQSIRDAQVGTMDAARAVAPARQELQDQYAKDIALAKAVGGGQASTVGALGQVASLRRARGAANLAPIVDSIRAREQGRLDGLVNQRMQQGNNNYYQRFRQAQLNLDQYNQDVAAAGQLGSVGRLNRRNALQGLLSATPGVMARVGNRGYSDKYSAYEQSLNNALRTPQFGSSHFVQPQYNEFFNPFNDQQIA